MKCINCFRENSCTSDPSKHNNENDHYSFQNKCPYYKKCLKELREEAICEEETKKQKKQQKQETPTQEDQQQICQTITNNIKDQIQNIIKENETTKTETMQEKLCENITNSLKTHVEEMFSEQLIIQI
ncbi:hypothetical protein CDAR_292821 [Caerostris darwini]|uniref:Uncharacterized protein n=1 Tax=Caerostris darwini TaxID=1538125 RepID=A0AAV4MBI7_9ARAC|nr:hypothetical protein CDAR_292821 [Caerostris darwini]